MKISSKREFQMPEWFQILSYNKLDDNKIEINNENNVAPLTTL